MRPGRSSNDDGSELGGAEFPSDTAWRIAAGEFDPDVRSRLSRGFAAWIDAEGAVPLERCLRLPRGSASFELLQRNRWLAEAAKTIDAKTRWGRAVKVSEALEEFITRGPWQAWRSQPDPPPSSSYLRTALFYVAKNNRGSGLSAKTVNREVGHLFR